MTDAQALERGRELFARKAWADSYRLLNAADRDAPLEPEDLDQPVEQLLRALHGLEQVGWRLKAKGRGVSDVQVAHHGPLRLDPSRLGHDVPNGVGEAADSAGDRD